MESHPTQSSELIISWRDSMNQTAVGMSIDFNASHDRCVFSDKAYSHSIIIASHLWEEEIHENHWKDHIGHNGLRHVYIYIYIYIYKPVMYTHICVYVYKSIYCQSLCKL